MVVNPRSQNVDKGRVVLTEAAREAPASETRILLSVCLSTTTDLSRTGSAGLAQKPNHVTTVGAEPEQ